jgi:anti-anti-sigma factor
VPRVELDLVEDLDLPHLPEVSAVLDQVLSLQPTEVVIDLSECRHIDAAAIGLLLDVRRRLNRRGAVLVVRAPHPRIRRILDTADLGETPRTGAPPPPPWPARRGVLPRQVPAARGQARVTPATS